WSPGSSPEGGRGSFSYPSGNEPRLHPGKRGGGQREAPFPTPLVTNPGSTPASGVGASARLLFRPLWSRTPAPPRRAGWGPARGSFSYPSGNEPRLHPDERGGAKRCPSPLVTNPGSTPQAGWGPASLARVAFFSCYTARIPSTESARFSAVQLQRTNPPARRASVQLPHPPFLRERSRSVKERSAGSSTARLFFSLEEHSRWCSR